MITNKLKRIYNLLDIYHKRFVYRIIFLIFVASFFEIVGLGMIIPLAGSIFNSNFINIFSNYPLIFSFLESFNQKNLILFFCFLVLSAFILKNIFLFYFTSQKYKFAYSFYNLLSTTLLKLYLSKDYIFFKNRNYQLLIKNITTESNNLQFLALTFVHTIAEILVFLTILFCLYYLYFMPTLFITIIILTFVFLFNNFFKVKLKALGQLRFNLNEKTIQLLDNIFLNIKQIFLEKKQFFFQNEFFNIHKKYTSSVAEVLTKNDLPRFAADLFFVSIFCILIFVLTYTNTNRESMIEILTVYTIAAYRLLPSTNKLLHGLNVINSHKAIIENIEKDYFDYKSHISKNFNQSKIKEDFLNFNSKIKIENLSFKYEISDKKDKIIFDNINFIFNSGSSLGILGESGSGKTTFLDLFTCLLKPNIGDIKYGSKSIFENVDYWQKNIGYVSQRTPILDDTLLKNITLDNVNCDHQKLEDLIKKVNLLDLFHDGKVNLNLNLGRDGSTISGGQAQRIGIMRCLFKSAKIIIFDEATNSLDEKNENQILDIIFSIKNVTKIIVSHNKKIVSRCDKIIQLENKKIIN
jgi:ABC-type multidrug transport system fused ATPase/permease subunit